MKIWITGAQGLVGKALQEVCKKRALSFVATGHAEVDISSPVAIHQFFQSHPDITHIINCAAYTKVDEAEKHIDEAFKANTLGPENLGRFAALYSLNLVHLSTDYVFDANHPSPLKEEDACCPSSVYARTKHEGETRLLAALPQACIIRTSWIFGSGGKNFISSLWDKLHQEKTIKVVDDQINRLTYAGDLASAALALLNHQGIYHFANQGVASRFDAAQFMKQILQEKRHLNCESIVPVPASTFPTPAKRPTFSVLDTQKIEKTIGIKPRPWQEALREYVHEQLA